MAACPRCSHPCPAGTQTCSECGASLPELAGTLGPNLDIVETSRSYPTPQPSQSADYLLQLSEAVVREDQELVEHWLKLITKNLNEFTSSALPRLRSLLQMQRFADPESDFPAEVQGLLDRGLAGYTEGLATMRSGLLEEGLSRMLEGNESLSQGLSLFNRG